MSLARDIADLGSVTTRLDTVGASSGALSNRNLIINGGMKISQRIGTTATAITNGNYGLDRWHAYYLGNSYTTQQVTDAPSGFYNSMKLLVTGTTTPTYSFFGHKLEGNNVNQIGLGTANCQSFTISFYVKSSVTGVYSISVTNNSSALAYPVQYTINSANTWERKTMTIPTITSGTWEVGSGIGIYLRFNMGSPSGRTDTADGWRSGNFDGADGSTGSIAWATTSGATFYMTGCQLEVGDTATDFEHRSYGDELARCYRYFERYIYASGSMQVALQSSTSNGVFNLDYSEKRDDPTITLPTNAVSGGVNIMSLLTSAGSFRSSAGSASADRISRNNTRINMTGYSANGAIGDATWAYFSSTSGDPYVDLDAEL